MDKIEGRTKERKIVLYSGHENNVVYLLRILDGYRPHVPPFGSYIVFEVHNINGVHAIKVCFSSEKKREQKQWSRFRSV